MCSPRPAPYSEAVQGDRGMMDNYVSSRVTFRGFTVNSRCSCCSTGRVAVRTSSRSRSNQFRVPLQTREGLASCRQNAVSALHLARLEFHVSHKTCERWASRQQNAVFRVTLKTRWSFTSLAKCEKVWRPAGKTPCFESRLKTRWSFTSVTKRGRVWRPDEPCPRHTRRGWSFTSLAKRARVGRPEDKTPCFASRLKTRWSFKSLTKRSSNGVLHQGHRQVPKLTLARALFTGNTSQASGAHAVSCL